MTRNLHIEYQAMRRERFKRGLYTFEWLSWYILDRTKIKVLRLQEENTIYEPSRTGKYCMSALQCCL